MKLLREPLVHFALLGAVLFGIYAYSSRVFEAEEARRVTITEADIEFLSASWERQWNRPPTEDELRGLVEARVREEVLYREALAVGLDDNDMVVRRRMVQKMELLSQDLASLSDPTDQELQAFFQERSEDYRVPPRRSFSHIYFNPDNRGATTIADAERVLVELRAASPTPVRAPELGDRFMLRYDFSLRAPLEVRQTFGSGFADSLFVLEPGWQGPILSGYGVHLVYVGDRVEARIPAFAEIRDRLVWDYARERNERAKAALYEGLLTNYDIEIDTSALRRSVLGAEADSAR
jgi:hypothetical protein